MSAFDFQKQSLASTTSSVQHFFQPKSAVDENSIQRMGEEQKDHGCSGWENDPQSFCTKVAKHFMQTEFGGSGEVVSIDVENDGGCRVHFDDGVKITIQKLKDQQVFVQVSPFSTKKIGSRVRCYQYTCATSGKMTLTNIPCSKTSDL
jgi:hypothetical protein